MKYHPLGRTGVTVSALSLGTVSLGVDYGIDAPGGFGRPAEADAIRLVRAAVERGVTLIDTAPAYGASERIVGRAVGKDDRVIVATKINPPSRNTDSVVSGLGRAIMLSLESSLRALNRDVLDIVQIHNATREMIADGAVADALLDAQRRGIVRWLGASVYGEEAAMAVVRSGSFAVVQVALNVLDQRMTRAVLPAAADAGVAVIARSAFLKGALTAKSQWLPDALEPLRDAAARARDVIAAGEWEDLPAAAMRFCLSVPHVSSVLTGARTLAELDEAIDVADDPPMTPQQMVAARALAVDDPELVDPSSPRWAGVR